MGVGVALLLAVAPAALASRTLETIDVPVKRADNATSATFDTKLKKGRLYSVRFRGSYRLGDTSWDPAYCFEGTESVRASRARASSRSCSTGAA